MKKMIIVLGSIAAVLLMVSSATAVPRTESEIISKNLKIKEFLNDIKENNLKLSTEDLDESISGLSKIILFFLGWIFGATFGRVFIIVMYTIECILSFIEMDAIDAIKHIKESFLEVIFLLIFSGFLFAYWTTLISGDL